MYCYPDYCLYALFLDNWGVEEEMEIKGYREGAEKECREHDLVLKCVSLLVQAK